MEEVNNSTSNTKILMFAVPLVLVLLAVATYFIYANMKSGSDEQIEALEQQVMEATPSGDSTTEKDKQDVMGENDEVKTFTVTAGNYYFEPKTLTVNKGDKVNIVFNNVEGTHDWAIDEFSAKSDIIQTGQTTTIEFTADKAGSFEYYCSIGSHRAMGMVGTLTVN